MESDLLKLDTVLSLTEDEAPGLVISQSDWEKGAGGFRLTLVGRLLTHRSVLFDSLKDSLVRLFQTARGVSIRKVSDSRFCLVFNHFEDLRRVLDLRPWIFDRNLVVLQSLAPTADPLTTNLDWSSFFVHVHDLPYAQRTVAVLRYIGDCLGAWMDEADINRDISWFENVRVRLNINVTVPLKRALRLRSEHGDEVVSSEAVRPTYVWRSPVGGDNPGSNRRGAHIFGDFRREMDDARWRRTAGDDHVAASTLFPERLISTPGKLVMRGGAAAAVAQKRLIDEESESVGLRIQGEQGIGPRLDIGKAGPSYLARSDSVGSSLGVLGVQSTFLLNLSGVSKPISSLDRRWDAVVSA
ncbi:hypothetical protein Salat_1438600 [Sesamum alatum]|uniref:DUF4283 domain-containing protein n=1 Tax=Sesamum alatum TaxID=300844 RepID=A0AAE1YAK8_9LAMI|nr:hypothetical protein Salat_1438600 [Sesamum alatum]